MTERQRRSMFLMFMAMVIIHLMNTTFTHFQTAFIHWMFTGLVLVFWVEAHAKISQKREPGQMRPGTLP